MAKKATKTRGVSAAALKRKLRQIRERDPVAFRALVTLLSRSVDKTSTE